MKPNRRDNLVRLLALMLGVWLTAMPQAAQARHRRHRRHAAEAPKTPPLDLSPVIVQPYVLPYATDPHRANVLRNKFHLENGFDVKGTRYITDRDVTSRNLFILQITQSLEGGFDSVNLYDRGVLSWGLMQWTAHAGSLHRCLVYVKRRLRETHRADLWNKLFVTNGLTVDQESLLVYGRPILTPDDARRAFRGTVKPGQYDPRLATHWVTVFARAGRQPAIQQIETEYAEKVVDGVLGQRLAGLPYHAPGRTGLTVDDLAGNDPYAEALIFTLWTNNPRHAWQFVADAARAARAVSVSDDPAQWSPGAFSAALLRRCHTSKFSNWTRRAEMVAARETFMRRAAPGDLTPFERQYQTVLAQRKVRRQQEMASRRQAEMGRRAAEAAAPHKVAQTGARPLP